MKRPDSRSAPPLPPSGGRPRAPRRGQAMVEFALVLPLMMILFLGVVELGMILHDYLTQVTANASAARHGMRSFGLPDANERIVDRFLEDRGHLDPSKVGFYGATGANLGAFTKSAGGTVTTIAGGPSAISSSAFFMFDGDTPDDPADDTPVSCLNVRASYVKVKTRYRHQMMVPGLHFITEDSEFPLDIEHVLPLSSLELGSNPAVNPSNLMGAFPITVFDQPFIVGQDYILKGKGDDDPATPGNFGWVNLDPSEPGNKNENIANWITGPDSPSATIPGWLGGFTGQRNAAVIRTALNPYAGKYIVIMIHDTHNGNGANLQYHEIGLALFRCETFTETGGGQPHLEITGQFVRRLF